MQKRRTLSEAIERIAPRRAGHQGGPPAGVGGSRAVLSVEIAAIRVENRFRTVLDDEKIDGIAASLAMIGLTSPVLVRPYRPIDPADPEAWGPAEDGVFALVAGAHRIEAVRRLGWKRIDTIPIDGPPAEMRLAEIDENLARAELTPLDRARFLAARKRVYERLHPGRKWGGDRKSRRYREGDRTDTVAVRSFAADAGERVGLSERTVRRALEIGENLDGDVASILALTPLANREGDLRTISRMPVEAQRRLAKNVRALDAPPRSLHDVPLSDASPPAAGGGGTPSSVGFDALRRAWQRASSIDRGRFRSWIAEGARERSDVS